MVRTARRSSIIERHFRGWACPTIAIPCGLDQFGPPVGGRLALVDGEQLLQSTDDANDTDVSVVGPKVEGYRC